MSCTLEFPISEVDHLLTQGSIKCTQMGTNESTDDRRRRDVDYVATEVATDSLIDNTLGTPRRKQVGGHKATPQYSQQTVIGRARKYIKYISALVRETYHESGLSIFSLALAYIWLYLLGEGTPHVAPQRCLHPHSQAMQPSGLLKADIPSTSPAFSST